MKSPMTHARIHLQSKILKTKISRDLAVESLQELKEAVIQGEHGVSVYEKHLAELEKELEELGGPLEQPLRKEQP